MSPYLYRNSSRFQLLLRSVPGTVGYGTILMVYTWSVCGTDTVDTPYPVENVQRSNSVEVSVEISAGIKSVGNLVEYVQW